MWELWARYGTRWDWLVIGAESREDAAADLGTAAPGWDEVRICTDKDRPRPIL